MVLFKQEKWFLTHIIRFTNEVLIIYEMIPNNLEHMGYCFILVTVFPAYVEVKYLGMWLKKKNFSWY